MRFKSNLCVLDRRLCVSVMQEASASAGADIKEMDSRILFQNTRKSLAIYFQAVYSIDQMTEIVFWSVVVDDDSGGEELDRRQEILEAAAKSFSLFGYKATTMDQVAKIANVGKGTIYTFFANKEELFNAIVLQMIEEMRAVSDAVAVEGASFEQNAHARLMQMLKFRKTHLLYAKLIDEEKELRTPAVIEVLSTIEQEIVSYVRAKIERAIEKGELKPCDTELVAYLIFKAYLAFVVDWGKTHDEELSEERIAGLLSATIFKGLLA